MNKVSPVKCYKKMVTYCGVRAEIVALLNVAFCVSQRGLQRLWGKQGTNIFLLYIFQLSQWGVAL